MNGSGDDSVYKILEAASLNPLWKTMAEMVPDRPTPAAVAISWPFELMRPLLIQAGGLLSAEEAVRRVLQFQNPGMTDRLGAAETLYAGLQMILPGGSDDLDNFEPMHPDDHRKHHMEQNDFRRWGAWAGGKKPKGPVVKGLGLLGVIPNITGILSGRIRTDTFDNFASDLVGVPSEEDRRKALEDEQRRLNPKWKPGDPILI